MIFQNSALLKRLALISLLFQRKEEVHFETQRSLKKRSKKETLMILTFVKKGPIQSMKELRIKRMLIQKEIRSSLRLSRDSMRMTLSLKNPVRSTTTMMKD